jgi:hypothetical protein
VFTCYPRIIDLIATTVCSIGTTDATMNLLSVFIELLFKVASTVRHKEKFMTRSL